ncbi:MAG TPA: histidinol-phosphate transaminase [Polyangia bacterium]
MSDPELQRLRGDIDHLDDEIVRLLEERAGLVTQVGEAKQRSQAPLHDPEREREVLERVSQRAVILPPALVRSVYRAILDAALTLERGTGPGGLVPLCAPNIESIKPYVPGKPAEVLERELGISGAIKLASNENPLGPSPKAVAAMHAALKDAHLYPEGTSFYLREALARKHGVTSEEVICGSGGYELLELLVRTFCTPEDEVLYGQPSFVCYQLAAQEHGVRGVAVPLDGEYRYDVAALLAQVTPRTKVLFLANPNNPTGSYLPRADFERLLFDLPPSVILAVDEAYFEYVQAGDYPDSMRYRNARERLISFRTFSKIFGLAGLRIGYAVASPEMIGYMNRVRPPFNVTTIAQAGALAALDDHDHVTRTREVTLSGRAYLMTALAKLGVRAYPSQANFIFVDVGRPSAPVYEALLRQGVIVRPIGGPRHFRVSVGRPEENERFVRALGEVLQ